MKTNRSKSAFVVMAIVTILALWTPWEARGDVVELVSVASDGTQGNNDSGAVRYSSESLSISADGRYVAFVSKATNLVPEDINGDYQDVFVHDRETSVTELVSKASDGTQSNSVSGWLSISGDGRYVAFQSAATNLVTENKGSGYGVFVHDRQTSVTELVSVASDGIPGNVESYYPTISTDGRYVVFRSRATNLVPGDTNGCDDIFVHDRQTGLTEMVSVASDGTQGNARSEPHSPISADGRYVAFSSKATNLVPGDTNGYDDIFVHDRQTGVTELVSKASDGSQANSHNTSRLSISADGRYVAFYSYSTNLVPNDVNGGVMDVFIHDRQTGLTELVSVASNGVQGVGHSYFASISADGRYVAFYSGAINLVPGDTNGKNDVFVHDRDTGFTKRISLAFDRNQSDDGCYNPSISGDGQWVAFMSRAANLVPGDTNDMVDIFVAVRGQMNTAPIADAGSDGNAHVGDTVILSGTATDPDGDPVTAWLWEFQSKPAESLASIADPSASETHFVPDMAGEYIVALVAWDDFAGCGLPDTAVITVTRPVADAGPDQDVFIDDIVSLAGTATHPGGDPITTWLWEFESVPVGSLAEIADQATSDTHFVPDMAGEYIVSLVACDDFDGCSVPDTAVITALDPRSGSGWINPDGGAVSSLDGSVVMTVPPLAVDEDVFISITDSGNGTLFELTTNEGVGTAYYMVTVEPEGLVFNLPVSISLSWPDEDNDGFVDGTTIREDNLMVVKDGEPITDKCQLDPANCDGTANVFAVQVISLSDFALFEPENFFPVADAGPDQSVHQGDMVTLDGSGSSDPDGDYPLNFSWQLIARPQASAAVLSVPASVNPTFTADLDGNYVVQLVVTDDRDGASTSDTVTVSSENRPPRAVLGCQVAKTVNFDGTRSGDPEGAAVSYEWDFGDGSASSHTASPTHQYPSSGEYMVSLTVTDDRGQSDTDHMIISVVEPPVDVVLVMDKSGSMSGTVPVSNGTQTKIEILKDSANLFLDLLRQGAGDELAVVSFSSPDDIHTIFGPSGLTAFNSGNVAQAKAAVNGLQPATSTDIRGGLQRGLNVLTAGENQCHRRVLIFFSDGKRTAGGDPTEAAFLQQFESADVHVYSVGFGTMGGTGYAGIDVNLLQMLTNANPGEPGFFHVTESAVALDKFFVNAVAAAIDAQVVVDPEGDLPGAQSRTVGALLGKQDYAVTFILTWDNPASKLHLAVRTPSGFEINAANADNFGDRISMTKAPAYKLMAIELPITVGPNVDQGGRWELVISNPGRTTVHYSASVISQSTIRADMTAPSALVRGGFRPKDPIPLLVTLEQLGGIPILGATVTVTPNVPLASLGSVLSSTGITRAQLAAIARETKAGITRAELAVVPRAIRGDNLSPAERLYLALQRRVGRKNLLPRADLRPIELAEAREHGEYLGSFAATRIEGTYRFVVHIEGVTSDGQPFQRELSYSVVVLPDPDPKRTRVTAEWQDPGDPQSSLSVTVTPVVTDGHLLGPGFSSQIRITAKGLLEPASEVVDQSDGGYAQTFRLVDRGPTKLKIQVAGIDLPPIALDTAVPFPLAVMPRSGSNDAAHTIVVSLAEDGDVSRIKNIALVDRNGLVVPLRGLAIDFKRHTVRAKIPRGLDPGLYSVQLESAQGQVPSSKGLTFEVVKRR